MYRMLTDIDLTSEIIQIGKNAFVKESRDPCGR